MLKKLITTTFAAAALTAVFVSPASAVGVNLLNNGGFEANIGLTGNSWGVYGMLPGPWKLTHGRGIEVQRGNIGGALPYEGDQKVELDSHNLDDDGKPANDNSNSGMTQLVKNVDAGTYEFSFAYLGRTGDAGTNGIGFSIFDGSNVLVDDVTGVRADDWQIFSYLFTLDEAANINVNFWAKGTEDTYGGYLDDIRLSVSAVPVPAALPLFGAALLGIGFLARRRKQKTALQA